jgi:hypothetical protein
MCFRTCQDVAVKAQTLIRLCASGQQLMHVRKLICTVGASVGASAVVQAQNSATLICSNGAAATALPAVLHPCMLLALQALSNVSASHCAKTGSKQQTELFETGSHLCLFTSCFYHQNSVLGAMYGWLVTDLAENGIRDQQDVYA